MTFWADRGGSRFCAKVLIVLMPDSKDESSFGPLYFTVSFCQKGQATLENPY